MYNHLKLKLSTLYIILLAVWVAVNTLSLSTFPESTKIDLYTLFNYINRCIYILLLIKTFFDFLKCSTRQRVLQIILITILLFSYLSVDSVFLYPAMIFILAARGVDLRKAFVHILNSFQTTLIIIVLSSFLGIIKQNNVVREYGSSIGRIRYSLGFTHPNILGSMLLLLSLLTLYLYSRSNKIRVSIVCIFSLIISLLVADSRTSAFLITLSLAFFIIVTIANKRYGFLSRMAGRIVRNSRIIIPIVFIVSILISTGVINIGLQDFTFQSRLAFMMNYMSYYSINLFGRNLYLGYDKISDYTNNSMNYYLYTLDNSYIYLLLGFGVIVTAWFIISYIMRIRMASKQKDYAIIAVLLIMAIDGFAETSLIRFNYNYFMLLFADLLWNYDRGDEKSTKSITRTY